MSIIKKKHSYLFLILLVALLLTPMASARAQAATAKWVTKNGELKYRRSNKKYARNGFFKINGKWYYFDQNGNVASGWVQVNSRRYYAAKSNTPGKRGVLRTGWQKIGNQYFYFLKNGQAGTVGKLVTGWKTIGGKKYYFRASGKTGVIGARYKSEWKTIGGKEYYFNQDGSLNTNTMTNSQFIAKIGKLAKKDMKKSGILASVTTAQAILESGYGTTSLGMEAYNLFGMKAMLSGNTWPSAWEGKTFQKTTKEYINKKWITITDTFRAYDSFAESLADHSAYLTYAKNGKRLRYKGVVGNKSYKKTIQIIKNGGYATDPDYVDKICNIIRRYNLTKYDK